MAASVIEQILVTVESVLQSAGTDAADRVERNHDAAYASEELPAITIRRGVSDSQQHSQGLTHQIVHFTIEFFADGVSWESKADKLHMQAHTALATSSAISALGRGLLCLGTDAESDSNDKPRGRLTARYQIQTLTRLSDMTSALT